MTRNNKLVLGVVLAAAALAAYWMLILSPKRAEATDLAKQVTEKESQVAQIEQQVATYAAQRKAYKVNYTTLVRLGKAVPGDDDVRSLMVQLDDAAKRTGVDFRDIEVSGGSSAGAPTVSAAAGQPAPPGATPIAAGFAAMPFKFTFDGRFNDLGGFFAKLERFVTVQENEIRVTGRLMRIESIDLTAGPKGYPQIEATIGASSYLAPTAKPVSAAGSATTTPAPAATTPASTGGSTPTTTTATATGAIR
jgi:outer membrane murein-binding lipoprotein Lpp